MKTLFLLTTAATALALSSVAKGSDISIPQGASSFTFVDQKGDPAKPMTVYTYLPAGLPADRAPIVFVMHGHGKNASTYRDSWIEYANRYSFMIVAPLFDPDQWKDSDYSYPNLTQPERFWSFSIIEHLFDAIKEATANPAPSYCIYGHSEGGQFVHRLVLLLPKARYSKAVAANPGWYTMPDFEVKFPYGLGGSPITHQSLKDSLGRQLILMLGDRDTDPNHKELRKTPEAMAQGVNRFERGQKFFKEGQQDALKSSCPFEWQLQVVPGVAHENSKMAAAAAKYLFGHP